MTNDMPHLWGGRRKKGLSMINKARYYQVTMGVAPFFAAEIARNINRDYPGVASVIDGKCVITQEHHEYCMGYVLSQCRLKTGEF